MSLDHLLTDRKSHPGSREFRGTVQPLKHLEDALELTRIHADTVVVHRHHPFIAAPFSADVNPRLFIAPEPDGIGDQVLERG